MDKQSWTIGELATHTGLTARALRHYEHKGLLGHVGRTSAGQRSYGRREVERIYQITALRSLGLPLSQITSALASPSALTQALADQLAHVDEQLEALRLLRELLQRSVDEAGQPVALDELITLVRHTAVSQELIDEYLDHTDQKILSDRATVLGSDATRIVQHDYPRLYRRAQQQLDRGSPPEAPAMQDIAKQLEELAGTLTGGITGPSEKAQRLWRERSEEITGRDWSELSEYVARARQHYRAKAAASG